MGMLLRRRREANKNLTKLENVTPTEKPVEEKPSTEVKKKSTTKKK